MQVFPFLGESTVSNK